MLYDLMRNVVLVTTWCLVGNGKESTLPFYVSKAFVLWLCQCSPWTCSSGFRLQYTRYIRVGYGARYRAPEPCYDTIGSDTFFFRVKIPQIAHMRISLIPNTKSSQIHDMT